MTKTLSLPNNLPDELEGVISKMDYDDILKNCKTEREISIELCELTICDKCPFYENCRAVIGENGYLKWLRNGIADSTDIPIADSTTSPPDPYIETGMTRNDF